MNNRYQYRIWDGKDMIDCHAIQCDDIGFSYREDNQAGFEYINPDYPPMQYTGMKGTDGKSICEGDIVHIDTDGNAWEIGWGYFGDTGFYGFNQLNSCRTLEPSMYGDHAILEYTKGYTIDCKVIGNIYENKDLLR